ncbi:hypothetical protein OB2597_04535 [Pseudooceanicola batsensis HTCC2597]|uniref:Bacteriophage phiJL001 Gp84 C-terminal domain-containing protein n=1 Tax=Pseudooceanicola batsensis (strain ATCC BAA-863 / DSM 15984 / KCTC 12145 / HTCC2597) TaxID=252305 RepID=A3U3N9_PSEBH|nr:DUF2163 domain-containing protein [Pseudooceanicola batsensis]EAQ01241.1 hypothetical protein OB2597_04535 [Pseudooceanicola batsensis HTCC2597]
MAFHEGLAAHLATGVTTTCHAWAIDRADGVVMGFTDHDRGLVFEGIDFRADSGLSALALQRGTGLAVDNSEAIGALTDAAIREADIDAGRFDGAGVRAWLVNWTDVAQRQLMFRGTIGEIRRAGGAFTAELRGLTEALNQPRGRVYQTPCGAVLGDAACGVDLGAPGYAAEAEVLGVEEGQRLVLPGLPDFEAGWFARGRLVVLDGAAEGLSGVVKRDVIAEGARHVDLWQALRAPLSVGDRIRIEAGCDKRMETCRYKFNNLLNYQGFPDIPGEDWMTVMPAQSGATGGGSRR